MKTDDDSEVENEPSPLPSSESDPESFPSLEENEDLGLEEMLLGQFHLVQFQTGEDNNFKHYIGQLIDFQESEDVYSFSFLRFTAGKFSFPQVEDFAKVKKESSSEEFAALGLEQQAANSALLVLTPTSLNTIYIKQNV